MATLEFHFCLGVLAVIEEHEVGHLIDTARRNSPLRHPDMTNLTLLQGGEAGNIPGRRSLMTQDTLQLERCVLLMVERLSVACSEESYGKQKATKESEYVLLYLLPPPAAITTYCFPFFFETNVIGVA